MTRKTVFGVDVDGVIADLATAIEPLIEAKFGAKALKQDVNRWNYYVDIVGSVSKMLEIMDQAWAQNLVQLEEPDLCQSLRMLRRADFHIVVLTARTYESHPYVVQWLHDLKVPYDSVCLLDHGGPDKLDYPIDVLLDDRPTYPAAIALHPDKFLYLRDQPWNRDTAIVSANAKRVFSAKEAVHDAIVRFSDDPIRV